MTSAPSTTGTRSRALTKAGRLPIDLHQNPPSGGLGELPDKAPTEPRTNPPRRIWTFAWIAFAVLCCWGCASHPAKTQESRPFDFSKDTFAYSNQLAWVYHFDTEGRWRSHRREQKPDYYLHCFVVARSAAQFFENAKFAADQPKVDAPAYRRLAERVVATNPREPLPPEKKIIIPGYADLRSFSADYESVLKEACGGAWQSYFQRGNWRMIFPFSRQHQTSTSKRIQSRLERGQLVLVHLVRFPQLSINHTVLVVGAQEGQDSTQFLCYDPNQPGAPLTLTFDRRSQTFIMPTCLYFPGGRVDVYEICHRWDY